MVDIDRIKIGLQVIVEDKGFFIPGVIMVIDHENEEIGVKLVFTNETRIFSVEKAYFRYPCDHQELKKTQPDKLSRLLGGYIITLAQGESSRSSLEEIVKQLQETGIAQECVKAQHVLANL